MTRLERREWHLRRLDRNLRKRKLESHVERSGALKAQYRQKSRVYVDFTESEALPYTVPEAHHHISPSRNFPLNITSFLSENSTDVAVQVGYLIFRDRIWDLMFALARIFCPVYRNISLVV
jgi:hypothetical protein